MGDRVMQFLWPIILQAAREFEALNNIGIHDGVLLLFGENCLIKVTVVDTE
jgi:hypothetical protein